MYGILNIYKEKGYTSHDVVAIIRKKLNIKKVGHTGTLDPQAEGVLPICIGKATKVSDILIDADKTYRALLILGIQTDTGDHTGEIIKKKSVHQSEDEIRQAVLSFKGEYLQTPPMYSALKINGKKLYELARQGKVVERTPRRVHIHDISIQSIQKNQVDMVVSCSKGTYIRTLCEDIGSKLTCGGHMSALTRLQSSCFYIQNSIKLKDLDDYIKNNQLEDILIKVESLYPHLSKIIIDNKYNKYLYNGNKLYQNYIMNGTNITEEEQYRVYDEKSQFVGLYEGYQLDRLELRPIKLFI